MKEALRKLKEINLLNGNVVQFTNRLKMLYKQLEIPLVKCLKKQMIKILKAFQHIQLEV
uniref:Uncharacterized protein n=1 Tax=Amphimedon queenslandica TaxID=400682 RepID=A0A1X7T7S6_AMPQE